MWNKLVKIIQKPSTKKLGLALLVSVILHGFLIGNFDASLPQIKKQRFYMDAQLELIKPVAKPQVNNAISELKPENPVKPSPARKIAQAKPEKTPIDPPKPEPSLASQDVDAVAPDSNVATDKNGEQVDEYLIQDDQLNSINAQTKPVEIKPPITAPEIATAEVAPQIINQEINPDTNPDEQGLIVNQQAYKYVETDFAVYTEINGSPQGKAKITYNLADDSAYQINSLIEPTGLAALIVSNLLQTSVGTLTKNGLQPTNYLYQYGNKVNKTYVANFDWQAKKVTLITAKGNKIESITEGTQDLLSFMYQFMHVAPLQNMQIDIATGKKLSTYDYSFEGEENINTVLGEIKTIHIVHAGLDEDEKTELWLAINYQNVPVKIRKTEKNGKLYELVVTSINTVRPTQN